MLEKLSRLFRLGAVLVAVLGTAACSPSHQSGDYALRAVQQVTEVERGVVLGNRSVRVSADGLEGATAGAAVGAAAGSQAPLATFVSAVGAAVGSVMGARVQREAARRTLTEYVVLTDAGRERSIAQHDEVPFERGDRVMIIGIGGQQARLVSEDHAPRLDATPPLSDDPPEPVYIGVSYRPIDARQEHPFRLTRQPR